MKVELKKSALDQLDTDVLVVFAGKDDSSKKKKKNSEASALLVQGLPKVLEQKLEGANAIFKGATGETVFFRDLGFGGAKHVLAVGMGSANFDHEVLRQALATALQTAKGQKVTSMAVALDTLPHHGLKGDVMLQAAVEGVLLTNYSFNDFKEKKPTPTIEKCTFVTRAKSSAHERGLENGTVIAEATNFARWMGDRPGNKMTPTIMAEEAAKAAKGSKLKVTAWDRAKIKSEKMGSFLGVSNGSSQEPRFIVMEYKGAAASKRPICFVGKGLTFDCGGISIKPSGGMEEMKYDMCGGAAVIGAMLAIARLKLKVNAIAFVPATENLVGPAATKPGDIFAARNGKTIEVNNTDAEGRLILADALVYACEKKPAWIVDVATLTGAMQVALGNLHTGLFTRSDKMASRVSDAAAAAGEWTWRMPLVDFHAKDMRGTYADLSNISSGKGAGSATAAAFLESFVDADIPWAHLDIAGTAWHTGDRVPYCPKKGASGAMVRTFVQMAMAST